MSFFKNLSVGGRVKVETQLQEWSKQDMIQPCSWTINDDLTVDVNGNVWLSKLDFQTLPVKFGKVTGYFSVLGCKNLTTLEGCPKEVGNSFNCDNCSKLTSLEGAPKKVGNWYYASNCGKKFTIAEVEKYSKVNSAIYV